MNAEGWVTALQHGQYAETILMDNALEDQASYPTGHYILLYDGDGTIVFNHQSASIVSETPGRMVVNVPSGRSGIYLAIQRDPGKGLPEDLSGVKGIAEVKFEQKEQNYDGLRVFRVKK